MSDKRFPLSWPHGRPRTTHRRNASFRDYGKQVGIPTAFDRLQDELDRIGARDAILSTNMETRLDGRPRADRAAPADPGVACYFRLGTQDTVLACDKWDRVADNIVAIAKHIEALRGQDRWGVGTLAQAFAGYQALPPPGSDRPARPWREVLKRGILGPPQSIEEANHRYRQLAKERAGDEAALLELNLARDDAKRELAP